MPRRSSSSLIDVVRLADVLTLEPRDLGGELAVRTDGIERRQSVVARDLTVDLTEGRCLVHETGALFDRHVVREHDVAGVDVRRAVSASVKGRW